ncbi:MAG: RdgB/HAM1 family non-canonical purine NTP pyrophosphatase [Gemmatimonadetes bacterium]|uniref:dITP/XTP pyrophosphatase n=1 Tax=Candidatus Kutchimonas denitrificans TaxID=3056748 RepID=A0AAE4ZAU1_9BACT|nr:RdgB/HAM1 family non-canonical purine NTP pyrophosphatase [Gemmatimonadota bacterium]NIR75742.1 RdgB/HAM1 family non-canonical purine NTP pyrophosphatase [Candidatus Kutchimonas denitrificans]NIS00355.1 RdgB/HAM1 family non-canonical purine NTP pyrophosphatase [Gemmatimonadota bacterium]NIT66014.1 RdgB/HAM1 family non-canonical purine NTP pyrophosphatase [Gemmatimonadota bacterium]NIU53718.1 RdgB/HAM1 family non-canonical purine NTP pyrophosphatase [Gemmatimonadota bacterium]
MKLALATRNPGKLREIEPLFRDTPVRLVTLNDLGVERRPEEERLEAHPGFAANAMAKARYFHDRTGLPMMAEDSGLCVDALDGAPGPRSRRYAPPEMQARYGEDRANNLHLLRQLRNVPEHERTAHFYCAVAVVLPDEARVFGGRVDGVILKEPLGEGGFGYDPLFWLPERGVSTAQLTLAEKNEVSHRGQAVRAAREWLLERLANETRSARDQ